MAYVRIESSVRTHAKFLAAGPAAAWLWVCGLMYCQEGLTDGFIPFAAVTYLGVATPRPLVAKLLHCGLWHEVAGGWQVHDYLAHNRSGDTVRALQADRRASGAAGGKASGETRRSNTAKQVASPYTKQTVEARREPINGTATETTSATETEAATAPPMDVWFRQFVAAYPGQGRAPSHRAETAFVDVLLAGPGHPAQAFSALMQRLDGHILSHQWRVKQMIPNLETYLRDGLHLKELPEHPVSTLVSEKTTRTLTSAAEFVKGGQRGA